MKIEVPGGRFAKSAVIAGTAEIVAAAEIAVGGAIRGVAADRVAAEAAIVEAAIAAAAIAVATIAVATIENEKAVAVAVAGTTVGQSARDSSR